MLPFGIAVGKRRRPLERFRPDELLRSFQLPVQSTSRLVISGIRHLRKETLQRHKQLGETLNNWRRETERRIHKCFTSPPSSAIVFAAMSAGFKPQPVYEIAAISQRSWDTLGKITVFQITSKEDASPLCLGRPYKPNNEPGACFIFFDKDQAMIMHEKLIQQSRYLEKITSVTVSSLAMVIDQIMKQKMRKDSRDVTYHFVPETDDVRFAFGIKLIKAWKKQNQEENVSRTEEAQDHIATSVESMKQGMTGNNLEDPDFSMMPEQFVGVPLFTCTGFDEIYKKEGKNPCFFTYRDMDSYIRTAACHYAQYAENQLNLLLDSYSEGVEIIKRELKNATGEEKEDLLGMLEVAQNGIASADKARDHVFDDILDKLEVDVTSLETVLQNMMVKERFPFLPSTIYAPKSLYQEFESKLNLYSYHLEFEKRFYAPEKRQVVPPYLRDWIPF